MIPTGKQSLNERDVRAVQNVMRSGRLTRGPQLSAFETRLTDTCRSKDAVATANATAALHLAYRAVGLGPGDEVITSPNTFVATTNMLIAVGARPVFVDIRMDTHNLDETQVENAITSRTKAIVPVHFAGQPCAMKAIARIARRHGLAVIEDASHALGATYDGMPVGACRHADMAVFSFHPVKPITTGEGGAVTVRRKHTARVLRHLRAHGIHKNATGKNVMTELGYNYRMSELHAGIGVSQLPRLSSFIERRRRIVGWYQKELAGLGDLTLPVETNSVVSGWHLYVVRTAYRDQLARFLTARGIGVNYHYPAVYDQPWYREHGYKNVSLPRMNQYQKTCLTLPCYPDLTRAKVREIADAIRSFFNV